METVLRRSNGNPSPNAGPNRQNEASEQLNGRRRKLAAVRRPTGMT